MFHRARVLSLGIALIITAACGAQGGTVLGIDLGPILLNDVLVHPPQLEERQVAYNASIAQVQNDYLMAFRVDSKPQDGNGSITQQVAVISLDGNFVPRGAPSMLQTPHEVGARPSAEDPRLVVLDQVPYVLYNAEVRTGQSFGRRMFIGKIGAQMGPNGMAYGLEAAKEIILAMPGVGRMVEKNWTPFIYEGGLHIIHQTNPPLVFRLDLDTLTDDGDRAVAHFVSRSDVRVPFGFGEMRGGTQAIFCPELDQYISFFHASKNTDLGMGRRRYYMMGAYTFDKSPPFAIRSLTRRPIATPEADNTPQGATRIAFPQGLVDDGERFVVSYGRDDTSIAVMTLDKQGVFDCLQPVN